MLRACAALLSRLQRLPPRAAPDWPEWRSRCRHCRRCANTMAVLMPARRPSVVTSAPPLLPGLMAASVWMKILIVAARYLGARLRRHDAHGHGLADAERIADRQHQIADLHPVGIREGHDRQASRPWARSSAPPDRCGDRTVSTRALNSRLSDSATTISVPPDHMIVGQDDAVGAHDHARAQALLHALAHLGRGAEELRKEGIVGEAGWPAPGSRCGHRH